MIKTPDTYRKCIIESMPNSAVEVIDIFLVPDYTKMLKGCGDTNFSDYAKNEKAQLQFTFESVQVLQTFNDL